MNWLYTITVVSLAVVSMTTSITAQSGCRRITKGGFLRQSVRIDTYDSPCIVQHDLIVGARATLTVDPGVTLKFAPGVMLGVNGTLIARVSSIVCPRGSTDAVTYNTRSLLAVL